MNNVQAETATSGLTWFKSSYSGAEGGDCVEVAVGGGAVHVRDSKDVDGPMLTMPSNAWAWFVASA